ncbi:hypothetical protein AB0958_19395 [Streptomyces sp. NPDC006655]|uniref:hypothetical protein n=1 Tax=Streptomyces sp. NPDC006655 TaxID=3156898 RepID=UPI0034542075
MAATKRVTIHMSPDLALRISSTARSYREAEKTWRRLSLESATTSAQKKSIRIEAELRRPTEWPTEDHLAEACLRGRMAQPDLARDWEPLTEEERVALTLPGMWPGSERPGEDFSAAFACTLDYDLVWQARTAAWRISEPWIKVILAEGLGNLRGLSPEQRERRQALGAHVITFGAIVRQGIKKHWPTKGVTLFSEETAKGS